MMKSMQWEKKMSKKVTDTKLVRSQVSDVDHAMESEESSAESLEPDVADPSDLEDELRQTLHKQFAKHGLKTVLANVKSLKSRKKKAKRENVSDKAKRAKLDSKSPNAMKVDNATSAEPPFSENPGSELIVTPVVSEQKVKLSKGQKKRQRVKAQKEASLALKDAAPKPPPKEPAMSSTIKLPQRSNEASNLDSEEKILDAVRARTAQSVANTLQIRPVPRLCPPGLLKDLCPLAVGIRFPLKRSARYAFLSFRNKEEMQTAEKMLSTSLLNGKPVKCIMCSEVSSKATDSEDKSWRGPTAREASDYDWKTLHVTGLPRSTTRMDLAQVFRNANSLWLPTFDDGSCKGACRLGFPTSQAALKAFETRHATFIHGKPICVNFSLLSKKKKVTDSPMTPIDSSTNAESCVVGQKRLAQEENGEVGMQEVDVDRKPAKRARLTSPKMMREATDLKSKDMEFRLSRELKSPIVAREEPVKHPKLLQQHQMKRKGSQPRKPTTSILSALFTPPSAKKVKSGAGARKRRTSKRR